MATLLNATTPPPMVALVDPKGQIREVACAPNIATPLLDREGKLTESARTSGWSTLGELYEAENDAEGKQAWDAMAANRAAGRRVEFPAELLPEEVRRRRAEAEAAAVWRPPKRKAKTSTRKRVSEEA